MTWQELLAAALTLVVGFAVRWFFAFIGVEISGELFATIVAGIVTYLLALFGVELLRGIRTGFRGGHSLFRQQN